jgi:hypothetical protein
MIQGYKVQGNWVWEVPRPSKFQGGVPTVKPLSDNSL